MQTGFPLCNVHGAQKRPPVIGVSLIALGQIRPLDKMGVVLSNNRIYVVLAAGGPSATGGHIPSNGHQ